METTIINRKISDIQTPRAHQGFLGPDHTARAVIQNNFRQSDPFIILMDDFLDKKDKEPVGGPHPHAGFETVSLLLEGEIGDAAHMMKAGDFQMMTAGSGIVHTESIDKIARMRLLQMWLNLPRKDRWTTPRVQDISYERVPKVKSDGVEIALYSGAFAGLTSPVKNYVPLIVADIRLQPGAEITEKIPASYNAFLYVVGGKVEVGEAETVLNENQIGWFEKLENDGVSEITLRGGVAGGRVILYAGEPQHDEIVSYGPFIADRQETFNDLFRDFRRGTMKHVSELPDEQRFVY